MKLRIWAKKTINPSILQSVLAHSGHTLVVRKLFMWFSNRACYYSLLLFALKSTRQGADLFGRHHRKQVAPGLCWRGEGRWGVLCYNEPSRWNLYDKQKNSLFTCMVNKNLIYMVNKNLRVITEKHRALLSHAWEGQKKHKRNKGCYS